MRPLLSASLCLFSPFAWSACDTGHWIQSVGDFGGIVTLEDGSVWKVDPIDKVHSSIWLPISNISVCNGNQLVNVDDDEIVSATPVNRRGVAAASSATQAPTHEIEAAAKDETFIINGEVYKAKTYCIGFEEGDSVTFAEGSAYGACTTATLVHDRTGKTCSVWCE